jgi:RNA polymerase sigma-B factor
MTITIERSSDQLPELVSARDRQHAERAHRTTLLFARASITGSRQHRRHLVAEVIEANMGVAEAIASRYRGRGIADEDLRQVAYLALTRAARNFDANAGHDFLSYAVPTIRGELRRYFRDHGWMVRPPRKVQELQSQVLQAQGELSSALGRSPSVSEVAGHLGADRADVEEALSAEGCFTPTSLDKELDPAGSPTTIGDLIGAETDEAGAVEARTVLAPALRRLSERDLKVLRMRFFEDRTQREIAEEIGVTQTQVSRVLARILSDLRSQVGPV